ncbi:MAG TPA: hypothetical protein EYG51_14830 [Pseudomonadales bacterium]|nr:hypothetical protein [Pseudomonadales bacterium]
MPKNSKRSVKKIEGREESRTYKTPKESANQDELVAPLTWVQRLKRVFQRAALEERTTSKLAPRQINNRNVYALVSNRDDEGCLGFSELGLVGLGESAYYRTITHPRG